MGMSTISRKDTSNLHKQLITQIEVPESGTSETFFTASRDGKIYEWSQDKTLTVLKSFEPKHGQVTAIKVDKNKNWLVAGFSTGRVEIIDLNTRESVELKGHTRQVNCVDITLDNKKIATGSADGKIIIWNTKGESMFEMHCPSWVTCLKFIPRNEDIIAASYNDGRIRVWNMETQEISSSFFKQQKFHESKIPTDKLFGNQDDPMTSIAVSPDGGLLSFSGRDGMFSIFSFEKNDFIMNFEVNSPVTHLAFGITRPLLSVATKGSIIIFDVLKNDKTSEIEFEKTEGSCHTLAWVNETLIGGFTSGNLATFNVSN